MVRSARGKQFGVLQLACCAAFLAACNVEGPVEPQDADGPGSSRGPGLQRSIPPLDLELPRTVTLTGDAAYNVVIWELERELGVVSEELRRLDQPATDTPERTRARRLLEQLQATLQEWRALGDTRTRASGVDGVAAGGSSALDIITNAQGGFYSVTTVVWTLGTASSTEAYLQHNGNMFFTNGPPLQPTIDGGPVWEDVLSTTQYDNVAPSGCTDDYLEGWIYSWHTARVANDVAAATDEWNFYCQPDPNDPGGWSGQSYGDDGNHSSQQGGFNVCDYVSEAGTYLVILDGEELGEIYCN